MPEPLTLETLRRHLETSKEAQRTYLQNMLTDSTTDWVPVIQCWTYLVQEYERRIKAWPSSGK